MSAHQAPEAAPAPRKRGRPKGYRCTPESRARMSAASKAALADPEVRARMSAASKAVITPGQEALLRTRWAQDSLLQIEIASGYSATVLRRWAAELGLPPKSAARAHRRAA